jgi:hypothetical protein
MQHKKQHIGARARLTVVDRDSGSIILFNCWTWYWQRLWLGYIVYIFSQQQQQQQPAYDEKGGKLDQNSR